jgi:hypothetical protein
VTNALRVLLHPIRSADSGEQFVSVGASVEFTTFGAGASVLKRDVPSPAKLTLHGTFLSRIRGSGERASRTLARLDGEVVLRGSGNRPVFIGSIDASGQPLGWTPEAEPPELEPAEAAEQSGSDPLLSEPSRRVLRLELSAAHFERVAPNDRNELVVTLDARRFRYLEVRAELELDGTVEAPLDVNDVLDVLITPSNPPRLPELITVRLTDERGESAAGTPCRVLSGAEMKDGGTEGTTDGEGEVRIRPRVGAEQFQVQWSTPLGEYTRTILVVGGSDVEALQRRLRNLGYFSASAPEDNVRAFQREFQREETGVIAHIAEALLAWHDRGEVPELGPESEVDNAPVAFSAPADAEDRSDPSDRTAVA